ncbi:MAG: flagellin [Planktomarina sp.]|nr:flagellin [Planktomarina sp.]
MTSISAGSAFYKVQAALDRNTKSVATSMERLATGEYGTNPGDRASSTMLANTMKSSLASNKMGLQNGREALNVMDVINTSLKTLGNILVRLHELNALGANGLNTTADTLSISFEAADLLTEYAAVQTDALWAGRALMTTASTILMNYGQNQNQQTLGIISVAITATSAKIKTGTDATQLQVDKSVLDVQVISQAHSFLQVSTRMTDLTSLTASYALDISSKLDVDFAAETTQLAKGQILAQAGTAMLAQANAQGQGMLALIQS